MAEERLRHYEIGEARLTVDEAIGKVQGAIDEVMHGATRCDVLEAGCGSRSHFRVDSGARITGIDISPEQLDNNPGLAVKILGDIQTHALPEASYDLVVCFYVLEHVPAPLKALDNMARALKPGGLMVIAVPSVSSFKGMVTKFSPHWFHVLFYRRVLGSRDAGKPGHPPFPTFLRWAMRPEGVRRFAAERELRVALLERFEDFTQARMLKRSRPMRFAYWAANALLEFLGCERDCLYLSDFVFVLQKPNLQA